MLVALDHLYCVIHRPVVALQSRAIFKDDVTGDRQTDRQTHCYFKPAFHDADTDSDSPDMPTSLRPTRAIS